MAQVLLFERRRSSERGRFSGRDQSPQRERVYGSSPRRPQDDPTHAWPVPRHLVESLSSAGVITSVSGAMAANAERRRQEAAACTQFTSDETLRMALRVFNRRGERTINGSFVQEWFFSQATALSQRSRGVECTRCLACLVRQAAYYEDRAKPWHRADQLCRPCMVLVLRRELGEDEGQIREAWRSLDDWLPVIDPVLAARLPYERRHFHND